MRRDDLIAGLSVAGLMLPEAVAYAAIAGLPAQRAIFAAIAGCLAYALVGRSRFAIVSPTSSSAAILAATLAAVPGGDLAKGALATVAVLLVGLLFLFAAAARLGGLTGFISRPVLRGFAFGLAVTIILRQLPTMAGVSLPSADIFDLAVELVAALPRWNLASVATGLVALAALLALRRFRALPGAFLVLAGGIAASFLFALPDQGVAVVGAIDVLPGWPSLPFLGWSEYSRLAEFTLPLVLILFAESWGTIRALALRNGDTVSANRELGALGAANIASALVQGMPVGAGFSAGVACEAAGAASRHTAVIAALGLAVLIAFAGPLVSHLPQPVLAAVVIAALLHALDPAPFLRLWRLDRDQYIALAAAGGVLLFGVLDGMLLAIALSLAAMIHRLASPHIALLGRLGTSHDYVDLARHSDATAPPGIAIWRPGEPLFFANAEPILSAIALRTRAETAIKAIVVSLEESFDLDSTGLDALLEFDRTLQAAGLTVQFARVHDRLRDLLAAAGGADLLARSSYSVDGAVVALERRMSASENPS
ncbi:MAG TPA: SulP family inorganic anion transporter [Alphaproteobacteria bacterium]